MIHEFFLALSGHSSLLFDSIDKYEEETSFGDSLKESNGKMSGKLNVANDYSVSSIETNIAGMTSVFHHCEITMISEILQVAKCYIKIKKFYETVLASSITDPDSRNEQRLRNGYYLTTFATAIYEETSSYREKIIQFEQDFLKSKTLDLRTILINMNAFKSLFLEFCHLINVVESSKLHGCQILNYLHKEVITTVGDTEIILKRIKHNIQKVLLEQLTYWLIYGELLDPHEELFLKMAKRQKEQVQGKEEGKEFDIPVEAFLVLDMLPDFIPLLVAEKIVFIGEHILDFETEGEKFKKDNSSRKGLILRDREKELLLRFESVSQECSFSLDEFHNLIETVRLRVSQHIYALVINAGIATELNHIKDIFLLGRGELYQAFFILSENKRPNITNVNSLFQRAGRQILIEESLLNKFIVTYEKSNQVDDKISVWKNLRIEYQAKWPLHKFFDSNVQEKYNAILRFLLDVREAQLRLQFLFMSQKGNKAFRSDNLGLLCWTLRHHMSLLICNLQYYIQVDVLETQFSELRKHIDNLEDYQRLCFHHQSFLSSVITQCFLSHPLISLSISSVLDKVKTFCNILESAPPDDLRSEIEYVKEEFDRAALNLFGALQTLGQNKNTHHTAPLALKIDYNRFYSIKPQRIS